MGTGPPSNETMAIGSTDMDALMAMLAVFAVVGTFGNALTLYVFSKMLNSKQHLTSTIFILTLAGTDFITSALIIPYTMYMEFAGHRVKYDFVCKCYHFLATTTVPYSAFIMVAIAVDRYICICHPFSQAMTTFRAKVVIISLACFAGGMGIITSLCYSLKPSTANVPFQHNISSSISISKFIELQNSSSSQSASLRPVVTNAVVFDRAYRGLGGENRSVSYDTKFPTTNITGDDLVPPLCDRSDYILDIGFQKAFQWFSSSLFLFVLVVVSILYSLIYRRVLQRRKAHPHIFSSYWCFCVPKPGIDRSQGTVNENGFEDNNLNERRSLRSPSVRSPNARADKVFFANLKIAVTLFVVTVVFVAAYLPAWLMALKVVHENIIVFYMYFTHNVVNPLVYSFMNQKFRQYLAEIGSCPQKRHS